jgi:5-methylcytosine-specific restriction protein A
MTRSVPEWIGKTADTAIPTRVRVRVFERCEGRCQACRRKLFISDKWECDHIVALCNGGKHRESNLQVLCGWCHAAKTKIDVAEKAKTYARRAKHVGIRKRVSRPIPGSRNTPWKAKIGGGWVRR